MRTWAFALLAAWALACAHARQERPVAISLSTDGNWRHDTLAWQAGNITVEKDVRSTVYQFGGLPGADQDTLATGFTLTLPGLDTFGGGTVIVRAYAVVSRHADPVSGTAIRDYRLVELATHTVTSTAASWVLVGNIATTSSASERAAAGAFNQAWRSSYWSGGVLTRTLLIVLKADTGGDFVIGTAGAATLTVTEVTARTGLVGAQYVRDWERGVGTPLIECPKTNIEFAADEAVRDGYTGKLVHPDGYDPAEPRPRRKRPEGRPWAR